MSRYDEYVCMYVCMHVWGVEKNRDMYVCMYQYVCMYRCMCGSWGFHEKNRDMASAPLFQALGSIHTSYRNHHGCITRPLCAPPTSSSFSSLLCRSVLKRRSTRVLIRNQDILITRKTRIDCTSTTQSSSSSSSSSSAVDDDNDASKCVLVLGGTGGVGN